MIPPLIVAEAIDRGIHLIAITDHNASANIEAVQKAAKGMDLVVLPGMELQTAEEVHVLCLFDRFEQIEALQEVIDSSLPNLENNPDFFGEQFIVDETGDFIRREHRLLLVSASLTLSEAWKKVNELEGLLIPAHVDRKAFGLISSLGFVPTDIPIEILEISMQLNPDQAVKKYPQIAGYPLIQSGDVHYLADFLGANEMLIEAPTISEIRKAILNIEGRSHRIIPRRS